MKKVILPMLILSTAIYAGGVDRYSPKRSMETKDILYDRIGFKFETNLSPEYNYSGDYSFFNGAENGGDFAFEISTEYFKPLSKVFDIGLGVAYQKHQNGDEFKKYNVDRAIDISYDAPEFNSVPVYAIGQVNLFPNYFDGDFTPFIRGDIGYSFNTGMTDLKGVGGTCNITETYKCSATASIDDGMYYGAGIGMKYRNFVLDAMYKNNSGEAQFNHERKKHDVDYSRVTIGIGSQLDIEWY